MIHALRRGTNRAALAATAAFVMVAKRIDGIEAKRLEPSGQCCAVSFQRLLTCLVC